MRKQKCRKFPGRGRFRCRVGVGRYKLQFVQSKNHYAYEMSPQFTKTHTKCVCVGGGGGGGVKHVYVFMKAYISSANYTLEGGVEL